MVGMNFTGRSQGYRRNNGGGKLMPLALAGLAAAAWYNRDKLASSFNKMKQNGGANGGLLGGLLDALKGGGTSSGTQGSMGGSRTGGAYRADGTDDSASYGAGIADEGSIPRSGGSNF